MHVLFRYGMMGWIFYDRALQQIQTQIFRNTTFTVTIIRDPHADEEPFCRVMLRVLTDTIRNFFPCRCPHTPPPPPCSPCSCSLNLSGTG